MAADHDTGYRPPRSREELDAVWAQIRAHRPYFENLCRFAGKMEEGKWYTLARFVRPENLARFRDMACFLIACCHAPLEFDNRYERIRRF